MPIREPVKARSKGSIATKTAPKSGSGRLEKKTPAAVTSTGQDDSILQSDSKKTRKTRSEALAENLPQLQNLIKRDPSSYKEEFLQQWRHWQSHLDLMNTKTLASKSISLLSSVQSSGSTNASGNLQSVNRSEKENSKLAELIIFLSHVVNCYKDIASSFPDQLISVLSNNYQTIPAPLRKSMVQALILLRNKDFVATTR
jgi:protein SDA1